MTLSAAVPNISAGMQYAGLVRRVVAYLLDLAISFAIIVPVAISMRLFRVVGLWTPTPGADPHDLWIGLGVGPKLLIILAYIVFMGPFYFILFHASPWQATLGKRLLKTFVTDDTGDRITLARSFGRWLAMWTFGLFGGSLASLITIPVSNRRKALHDMAAGTVVLSGQAQSDKSLEPWRVFVAFGIPFLWLIATFLVTLH